MVITFKGNQGHEALNLTSNNEKKRVHINVNSKDINSSKTMSLGKGELNKLIGQLLRIQAEFNKF
jgi:hypothetical protein